MGQLFDSDGVESSLASGRGEAELGLPPRPYVEQVFPFLNAVVRLVQAGNNLGNVCLGIRHSVTYAAQKSLTLNLSEAFLQFSKQISVLVVLKDVDRV